MSVNPAEVSYVLSSMASVGPIFESLRAFRKKGKAPTLTEYEEIESEAREEVAARARAGGYADAGLAKGLSSEVLGAIRIAAENIVDKMKAAASDPRPTADEKFQVMDREQSEYCKHLKLMKRFNGDRLPADLVEEWERNSCDNIE